jgi:hypothetical protein
METYFLRSLAAQRVFPDVFKALKFLEECQNLDGGISGMAKGSDSTAAPTAYVLQVWALLERMISDYRVDPQRIQKTKEYLYKTGPPWKDMNQNPNVHSTSRVMIALMESGARSDDPKIIDAAKYIVSERNDEDNGWGYKKGEDSHPYFTYFAIKALKLVDRDEYSNYINEGVDFIYNGLKSKKWFDSPYSIALSTLLLMETDQKKYVNMTKQNISFLREEIEKEPWAEDSYETSGVLFPLKFYTPLILHTLLTAGLSPLDRSGRRIIKWLRENQSDDGGWKWGTPKSLSWTTSLSVIMLLDTLGYVAKSGLGGIYADAYTRLEEIRTSTIDSEKLIEREKKIVQREKQARNMGMMASLILIFSEIVLFTIYLDLIAPFLRGVLEQTIPARTASRISFIFIPILLLVPLPFIGYYLIKGYLDRASVISIAIWILSVIAVDVLLVILFELIG